MMREDEVVEVIYEAIRDMNRSRSTEAQVSCSEDVVLFGPGGALDSLALVSLILDVEDALDDRSGRRLVLADERAMSQRRNPFRDVRSLADYVMSRLAESPA